MPPLNRNEKINCENCGAPTTKRNVRHKTRCSAGSLTRPSCTKLSTKSRSEKNYHIAKKHSKATARVVHKGKICDRHSLLLQIARTKAEGTWSTERFRDSKS